MLSAIMVFTMMPFLVVPAYAAEGSNPNWFALRKAMLGEEQGTVNGFFEVSTSSDARVIKLLADISANGASDNALKVNSSANGGKEIFLDLNGHTLNRGLIDASGNATNHDHGSVIENEGTLTINDTSDGADGKITG